MNHPLLEAQYVRVLPGSDEKTGSKYLCLIWSSRSLCVCIRLLRFTSNNRETSTQTSGRDVHLDAHACCPPIFNNVTLRRLYMQLRAPLCLVFYACYLPMDATSCFALPPAPCLLPAHWCSFVLRACYHAHGYNFVLCAYCRALFASYAHMGTAVPNWTTFAYLPCHACSWNTCNIKAFAATYVQNRWNIYNICWQHMCMALHYMQHPIKTLATYVWNSWNTHLQHMCIASATYATSI
jgi:hypothetical protein